jgi:hypothetical protein
MITVKNTLHFGEVLRYTVNNGTITVITVIYVTHGTNRQERTSCWLYYDTDGIDAGSRVLDTCHAPPPYTMSTLRQLMVSPFTLS